MTNQFDNQPPRYSGDFWCLHTIMRFLLIFKSTINPPPLSSVTTSVEQFYLLDRGLKVSQVVFVLLLIDCAYLVFMVHCFFTGRSLCCFMLFGFFELLLLLLLFVFYEDFIALINLVFRVLMLCCFMILSCCCCCSLYVTKTLLLS